MRILPYAVSGDASLPSVVFIHGFFGQKYDWNPLISKLPRDRRYITVDLPGHGKAIFNDDSLYSFDKTVELLANTLDQLSIQKCDIVGYSLGGRIGLGFSVAHPERVNRLFLISSLPGIENEEERKDRILSDEKHARDLKAVPLIQFLKRWYQHPVFETLRAHPKFQEIIEYRSSHNSAIHLSKAVVEMSPAIMKNYWKELENSPFSLFYITGEKDLKYVEIAKQLKARFPSTKIKILPNVGHAVHIESRYEILNWLMDEWRKTNDNPTNQN